MLPAHRLPEQAALFGRAEARPMIPGPDLTSYDIILAKPSGGAGTRRAPAPSSAPAAGAR